MRATRVTLQNDGESWEFFDAWGFRVDTLADVEQFSRCAMRAAAVVPGGRRLLILGAV
jgi:hypothetical protein